MGGPPIVAGELVYAASADHHLYAVDRRSGTVRWRHRRYDGRPSLWTPRGIGYGRGMLFLGRHPEGDQPALVYALDALTGEPRWQVELPNENVLDVTADDDVVVVNCVSGLRCLEASDGSRRWRYAHEHLPRGRWGEPAIVEDAVLCAAGSENLVLAVAVGLADGVQRWEAAAEARDARMAGGDGIAVIATSDGLLAAVTLDTGETLWTNQFEARATETVSTVAALPGSLRPRIVSHTPVSARLTAPVVTSDRIFVGCGNGSVYSFDREKRTYWNWVTSVRALTVCHSEGVVYAGFFDGSLAAYPEEGGDLLWWLRGPIGPVHSMAHADGVLYVSGGKCLAAFDASDGAGPGVWRWRTRRVVERPSA
jgi:outer membrane protein assembly factor BamB